MMICLVSMLNLVSLQCSLIDVIKELMVRSIRVSTRMHALVHKFCLYSFHVLLLAQQTNLHLSRELQSLKAQMEEMKNMMRLSFDLQMDIQRAIRQEVAAAVASATGVYF